MQRLPVDYISSLHANSAMHVRDVLLYFCHITVPGFVNFNVTNTTATSVTAFWTLDNPGNPDITALQQMTVRWVRAQETLNVNPTVLLQETLSSDPTLVFPRGNVAVTTFDVDSPEPDGRQFNQTFQSLEANSEYIVRIEGVNSAGTSVTLFAFETGM